MTLCMGRRVPTPSLSRNQISSLEETKSEELSSRKQEQAQKVRCKQPLQRRAGLENVAPCQVLSGKKTSPCKMISASPNKENEEAVPTCIDMQNMFSKRKLFEKEASVTSRRASRRELFWTPLTLLPVAARAEEGLTKIGNDQFSIELPKGFSWNEKFILAKTHTFERSVTASDPYSKWKVGITIDEVFANSLSDVGSADVVADRIASIEKQKDGNFTTDVLSAKDVNAGDIQTYVIEYRCDTSRGYNHFLVRVALQKGRLYTVTSQAPEEQWSTLEEATRTSFDSFRLAG
ncbi:PsbP domain-containing protein [Durusdinium trenchii]|uniref:PsbP domain-containing protein n=1 Tax=Durusdinium trenchii TaxID=1381693 RepID=A0ABP0HJJ0_9DINO